MTGDGGSGNWTCAENSMRYSRVLSKKIPLERLLPRQVFVFVPEYDSGCADHALKLWFMRQKDQLRTRQI